MRSFVAVPVLLPLLSIPVGAASQCYKIDGSTPDGSFVPCNATAGVSACCASNKSGGDVCLSGGLCLATSVQYAGFIYGNGCTDATGEDPACPSICPPATSSFWGGKAPDTYNLLQCTPGTWCCRHSDNATSCCNDKRPGAIVQWKLGYDSMFLPGLLAANTLPVPASASPNAASSPKASSSSSFSSSSSSSSSGSTASSSASSATPSKPGSASPAVVGAAVGVSLGVLLLIAAAVILWMGQKIRNLRGRHVHASGVPEYTPVAAEKRAEGPGTPMKPYGSYGRENGGAGIVEIGHGQRLPELA